MNTSQEQLDIILSEVCGVGLEPILRPILQCIEQYGALPFSYSAVPKRFRTTVQASCLLSLYQAKLMDPTKIKILQSSIVSMRDSWHSSETDFEGGLWPPGEKHPNDKQAWCITETPSVWSTSYAIWSLVTSGYGDTENYCIWPGIEWLISQQDETIGGFAYQNHKDCIPTVYLTCLAIKAIRAVSNCGTFAERKPESIPILQSAIARGLTFIKKCSRDVGGAIVYAKTPDAHGGDFDWISTIWAYTTLTQNKDPQAPNTEKLLTLLRRELITEARSHAFWERNNFVNEAHTKYGGQKTYFYFMPNLLVPLIGMGLDPTDPICTIFLHKLRELFWKIGWPITEYRRTEVCTFSTALGLQAFTLWANTVPIATMRRVFAGNQAIFSQLPSREDLSELKRGYDRKIKRLKRFLWAVIPFIGGIISGIRIPWHDLISNKNPFLILAILFEAFLILCIAWLCTEGRQRRILVNIIGLIAAIVTIVLAIWAFLVSPQQVG